MQVKTIEIADIEVTDRLRPVTAEAVKGLAEDIAKRGLRQPIEVVAQTRGSKYRLVAGAHRLAACKSAELETIAAFVVSGTNAELRQAELLENLARNELSTLERVQFVAESKRLYQEAHPDAKHGGDRTQEQEASLASWYKTVGMRSQNSVRTVKQYAAIGLHLNDKAAETLRRTVFENSLKELEALARLKPDVQVRAANALSSNKDDGPKTVAQAVKIIEGHATPEQSPEDKQLKNLTSAWDRAAPDIRKTFLAQLRETGDLAGM